MRNSRFESRKGYPSCTPEVFCNFITDLRNFQRLIPANEVSDLKISRESCSFVVAMLGKVTLSIAGVEHPEKVYYSGNALQINDFDINVFITSATQGKCQVVIILEADLNPLLKMLASGPVERLLAMLIDEVEKTDNWN